MAIDIIVNIKKNFFMSQISDIAPFFEVSKNDVGRYFQNKISIANNMPN